MTVAPGLILGALLVVIATQITRITIPGPGPYLWTLMLAAAGFLLAEVAVAVVHSGGPSLGVLHPVADAASMALVELAGALTLSAIRRRRTPP